MVMNTHTHAGNLNLSLGHIPLQLREPACGPSLRRVLAPHAQLGTEGDILVIIRVPH